MCRRWHPIARRQRAGHVSQTAHLGRGKNRTWSCLLQPSAALACFPMWFHCCCRWSPPGLWPPAAATLLATCPGNTQPSVGDQGLFVCVRGFDWSWGCKGCRACCIADWLACFPKTWTLNPWASHKPRCVTLGRRLGTLGCSTLLGEASKGRRGASKVQNWLGLAHVGTFML